MDKKNRYFYCIYLNALTFAFLTLPIINQAQSLNGVMKYIFIDGEELGEYTGGITIQKGVLKVGDVVKPKDEVGVEFQFKIIKITDNETNEDVKTLAANKDGFIVMQTLDKKKLLKNPTGSFYFGDATSVAADLPKAEIGTRCKVNGLDWKGANYYNSSVYYPNGNSFLKTNQPYLIISFKSAQSPDDRQITLIHKEAKIGKGVLDKKNYEVVLSGSSDGIAENSCLVSNWKDGKANTQKTDFYFEITKFEEKKDFIIVSAKYSGKIYGLNLFKGLVGAQCKDVEIKDGEIVDLKILRY